MYNFLIGQEKDNVEKLIKNKKIIFQLSKDKQIKDFNKEIVVRVIEEDDKLYILTALFKY